MSSTPEQTIGGQTTDWQPKDRRPTDWHPTDWDAVPPEVVRDQLQQILLGPQVAAALQRLHELGVWAAVLPEVGATVGFAQEVGRRHKDVWAHTKQVVQQCEPEAALRWAALLHDIGKVPTRQLHADGKVTFLGHAEQGARMFDAIARRLAFPRWLRQRVRFLIRHHQRANQYDRQWTDAAVRRLNRQMGHHLDDLLRLSRADITSAIPQKRQRAWDRLDDLTRRVVRLREQDRRIPPLPSGLGDAIMTRFDLPAGRQIGAIKRRLEQAIEGDQLEPHRETDYYLDYLMARGIVAGDPWP